MNSSIVFSSAVQVGAYARFVLAQRYSADGQSGKADKLIEELKQAYTDAIDHRGRSLLAASNK